MNGASSPRAIFLDRDGTVIVDKHYLGDLDGVELERGAVEGLRRLSALGWRLVGITNQSGIARGLFDLAAAEAVNARVDALLAGHGIRVEGWYVCPHDAEAACACRKPAPGLALRAAGELGLDPAQGVVIGDKLSDVAVAAAIGARGILVRTGEGARHAAEAEARGFAVAADLAAAAALIARQDTGVALG